MIFKSFVFDLPIFIFLFTQLCSNQVTCIGASITEGACIEILKKIRTGQLQSLLGKKYKVSNFGVSSSTMLKKGNFPYWETDAFQHALQSAPDIVLIDLGGNDAKAINRPYYNELELDCRDMIRTFKDLPSHPRVIILLPTPTFVTDTAGIYDSISKMKFVHVYKKQHIRRSEVVNMHSRY
jgi:lysophospholipase L1-like esterase